MELSDEHDEGDEDKEPDERDASPAMSHRADGSTETRKETNDALAERLRKMSPKQLRAWAAARWKDTPLDEILDALTRSIKQKLSGRRRP